MKRILHPSDFSKASRPAFKKAIEMAKTMRATLDLLHVMAPVPILGDGYISPKTYDELLSSATESARRQMERLVKTARAAGVKTTSTIGQGSRPTASSGPPAPSTPTFSSWGPTAAPASRDFCWAV